MEKLNVYIETYGCALAQFDTALMISVLKERGHLIVKSPERSDVIIVNTCAVRLDTEQRIVKRLRFLAKTYPDKKLVIAGCLAKARPGLLARNFPKASLVSPQNSHRIWKAVEGKEKIILLEGSRDTSLIPLPPVKDRTATIMIQEGCLGNCSFCITKLARRELRSYPKDKIVETVAKLVQKGAVEIRLTGQDTAAYGIDIYGEPVLHSLIDDILRKVEGEYRIRVGMMTPELGMKIMDQLLDVFKDERMYKFFHIPVQSGDDNVLKIMNRKYTVSEYKNLIYKIRSAFPDAMIATDIIVGHPGEDEYAFKKTIELVKELKFERVHIAQYTIRPRTLSASLKQVPDPIKKERSTILSKIVEEIGKAKLSRYKGKTIEVLITERGFRKGSLVGRLNNYIPVIIPEHSELLGKFIKVKVVDNSFYDLRGIPCASLSSAPLGSHIFAHQGI